MKIIAATLFLLNLSSIALGKTFDVNSFEHAMKSASHPLIDGFRHRHLQTCDIEQDYEDLFDSSPALAQAQVTYQNNLEDEEAFCVENGNNLSCTHDGEVAGSDAFERACRNAGGTPKGYQMSVSCSASAGGERVTFDAEYPEVIECVPPTSCAADEIDQLVEDLAQELELELESELREIGATSVNCDFDVKSSGGPDSAGFSGPAGLSGSAGFSAFSSSALFAAVMMVGAAFFM